MSTTTHHLIKLLSLIGVLALLLLLALPLAAQDDAAPPAPAAAAAAIDPTAPDLPPAPDLSMLPDSDDGSADPVEEDPLAAVQPAPESTAEIGADQPMAPDQQASCRPKGIQIKKIEDTTTTWVSALPHFYPSPQPPLRVGNVYTGGRNYALWTLVKFNYDAGSLPNRSQICEANIWIDKTSGSYDRGVISPVANLLTRSWSPGQSFAQISQIPHGAVLGGASLSGGTLHFEAKGAAQAWLTNPGQNFGIVIQTSKGNTDNIASFRQGGSLELKIQCDFYTPTSSLNGLDPFSKPGFKVSWGGTDPRDPASTNCNPSGIETYRVQYRVPGSSWGSFADTSSTSKHFPDSVADGAKVEFEVAAVDHARNAQSYGSRVSTIVDKNPPWVVVDPPFGPITYDTDFDLRWRATDDVSGPKSCALRYRIDGTSWKDADSEIIAEPSQHEKIFRYRVTGANQDQLYRFEIMCRDNVGNVTPAPVLASTTVSLYPDAGMNNITPNYVNVAAPFQLGWYGKTPADRSIASYDVYYRNSGQAWQSKRFGADVTSATFPFDGSAPAAGLWEFETTATNDRNQTTPVKGIAEAAIIVDPGGSGGLLSLPLVRR